MNIILNFQICEVFGRTCGYKFIFHSVEFEEFIIKKIMNKEFEELIVATVLEINPEMWFYYFSCNNPVLGLGSVLAPKNVQIMERDGIMFRFISEPGESKVITNVSLGQSVESCCILDFDVSGDYFINVIKFNKSKEDSFSNYFEQTKLFKKVVTILVSHQKVGIQFSGVSKSLQICRNFLKTFSKNFDKFEKMELNEIQHVGKVGKRK
jgi:hypothetical protein